MPTHRKSVSVHRAMWNRFRTSTLLQTMAGILVIVIIAVAFGLNQLSHYQDQRQAERERNEQAEQQARLHAEQQAASEKARAEAADKEKRDQLEERARLLGSIFHLSPQQNKAVILCVDASGLPRDLQDAFVSQVSALLSKETPSVNLTTDGILPEFYSRGFFDSAFGGDVSILEEGKVFQHAAGLLLVKPKVEFKDLSAGNGMKSCGVTLILRAVYSSSSPSKQIDLHAAGTGFSDESSLANAFDAFPSKEKQKLQLLVKEK